MEEAKVYDYSKLKGRIVEVFGTQEAFATAFGCARGTFSLRLNGKRNFRQDEILNACQLLHVDKREIPDYFFTLKG